MNQCSASRGCPWRIICLFFLLAFKFVFLFKTLVKNYHYCLRIIGWSRSWVIPSASWPLRCRKRKKQRSWVRKNDFLSFAVDWPFEFLHSHLHCGLCKTTGANCRWNPSPGQVHTSATGSMSLDLKDGPQQPALCPWWQGRGLLWTLKAVVSPCGHAIKTIFTTSFQKLEHWFPTSPRAARYN